MYVNFSGALSGIFQCWELGHPKQRKHNLDLLIDPYCFRGCCILFLTTTTQHFFISPHNIQEIKKKKKFYNSSIDNDRGAGCPK